MEAILIRHNLTSLLEQKAGDIAALRQQIAFYEDGRGIHPDPWYMDWLNGKLAEHDNILAEMQNRLDRL